MAEEESGELDVYLLPVTVAQGTEVTEDLIRELILAALGGVSDGSSTSIVIGSFDNVFKASTEGIWLGSGSFSSAPFSVSMTGALVATSATITGTIVASAGSIGGFSIGSDYIRDVANSFGLASTIAGGDDVRFWAGAAFADRATAPFRLTEAGVVTASSGTVGGWTLGATSLTGGSVTLSNTGVITVGTSNDVAILSSADATYRLWIGNATAASAPFSVTKAGAIFAVSGTVGGWTLGATTLTGGSVSLSNTGVITVGTVNDVAILSSADATYRLWAGHATAASAPFSVTKAGAILASSGTVGGWTLGASTLVGGNVTLSNTGVITVGTSNDVAILSSADATYRLWVGNATAASAPFSVTKAGVLYAISGTIAGWTMSSTTLTSAGGGIVLDNSNNRISVGTGSPNILIDGAAGTIGTSTFASGQAGWRIDADGDAEFNNITARGEFRSSVFVKNEIHATGGSLLVLTASTLYANLTTVTSPSTASMDINDPPSGHAQLFAVNDIVRLKDGSGLDNWLKITAVSDQTTFYRYTVDKQSGTNGTFYAGTAVVNYKQSADGFVLLTSDLSNAPYVEIGTNGATPWISTTPKVRLGNLSGITDSVFGSLSGYGLWTDSGYFSGSVWASAGRFGTSTNYWSISSGVLVATGAGDVAIRAGQTDYDTGTGFWLGLKTGTAKLSLGNSAGDKLTWDGTNVALTGTITAAAGAIGGWTITSGYIYDLTSGTPTSSPNNGIVLDSGNAALIVYEGTAKRVQIGYLSAAVYGILGYATDGSTKLFELSDTQNMIAGWTISSTTLANSTNIILDASNKAISINSATFGTDGIQIQYNAGDPRIYAGNGANKFFKFDGTDTTFSGITNPRRSYTAGDPFVAGDTVLLASSATPDRVVASQTGANGTVFGASTGANQRKGDTFTPSVTAGVTQISISIKANAGGYTGAVTVKIQTDSGGQPDGVTLASATQGSVSTTTTVYNLALSSVLGLTAGVTYWITLESTVGDELYDASFNNAAGTMYRYDGSSWNSFTGELYFTLTNVIVDGQVYLASGLAAGSADGFLGLSVETTAMGGTALVQISDIFSGLSGLTIGSAYYLSDTYGDYSTTPGTYSKKIGRALSTTELQLKYTI